jgi:general secretion pathway protein M
MTTRFSNPAGWLAARAPRERRLIALAATVVSIAAVISVAEWSGHERARVAQQLPQSQARLAKMQQDAAELAQLARLPAPTPVPVATLAQSAGAAAASRGLALEIAADGSGLAVSGNGSFDALIDWLASIHAQQRLRVSRITMRVVDDGVELHAVLTPAIRE